MKKYSIIRSISSFIVEDFNKSFPAYRAISLLLNPYFYAGIMKNMIYLLTILELDITRQLYYFIIVLKGT